MSKTEQDLKLERQKQEEDRQYQAFKRQMEREIKDHQLRISWLRAKKELSELSEWYTGEAQKEREATTKVVDEMISKFELQDKKEEIYKHFRLPLPKMEVGNIEEKKEESKLETPKVE